MNKSEEISFYREALDNIITLALGWRGLHGEENLWALLDDIRDTAIKALNKEDW